MPVGIGAAVLGGSVIGGLGSYMGSNQAASSQNKSTKLQKQIYRETQANLAPYRELGGFGISSLKDLLANPESVTSSPEYKFQLGEGLRALSSSAAAGGTLQSGATLRDVVGYGQGLAGSMYQNKMKNLMDLVTIGSGAAAGGSPAAFSQGIGESIAGAGAARAAGTMGMFNATSGGLQDYFLMKSMYGSPAGGGTVPLSSGSYYGNGYVAPGGSFGMSNADVLSGAGSQFGTY